MSNRLWQWAADFAVGAFEAYRRTTYAYCHHCDAYAPMSHQHATF